MKMILQIKQPFNLILFGRWENKQNKGFEEGKAQLVKGLM